MELSPEAKELLLGAANSCSGIIRRFCNPGGSSVIVEDKVFGEQGNPRSEVTYYEAVDELDEHSLAAKLNVREVEEEIFRLTSAGYEVADGQA